MMQILGKIRNPFRPMEGHSKKCAYGLLLLSTFVSTTPMFHLRAEQNTSEAKSDTKNLKETPSSVGAFTLPRSNHRFWFYMDNLERQLVVILKDEEHDSPQASSIKLLLNEAKEIKKSRVTYREVRDYLEVNHRVLSELGVIDPHNNGFKEN